MTTTAHPAHGVIPVEEVKSVENNVYDYFTKKLDIEPNEESLKELPIGSNCGVDCVRAIDAAAAFMAVSDPLAHSYIVQAANETVEVFWVG